MGLSNLSFSATNINAGKDADKPPAKTGNIYIATDTLRLYCPVDNSYGLVNRIDASDDVQYLDTNEIVSDINTLAVLFEHTFSVITEPVNQSFRVSFDIKSANSFTGEGYIIKVNNVTAVSATEHVETSYHTVSHDLGVPAKASEVTVQLIGYDDADTAIYTKNFTVSYTESEDTTIGHFIPIGA